MQLGLGSYTYGWAIGVRGYEPVMPMTELDLLDRAVHHGVDLVQVCDNLPIHQFSAERLTHFNRQAMNAGIRVEVGSSRLTLPRVVEMIHLAKQVRSNLIRFVIDGPGFHPNSREVIQTLREVEPLLDGLRLGLENHDRFPARTLRSIMEEVNSERIGICLDTANSLGAGEGIRTVVSELGPFTINLHIKDFQIERVPHLMGFRVEGRPAGEGMLDLLWLLNELAPFRRCETAVLELWTPPEKSIEETVSKEELWAGQSLIRLKQLWPTLQ